MSMPLEKDTRVSTGDVEVDHVFLRKAIGWLQNTREEAALKALLGDLHEYLVTHFTVEERAGGFFEAVLADAPHYQSAVSALRRDHQAILAEAESLRAELGDEPRRASDAHLERAQALARALEEHERREEGLLQVTLERDLHGGN